MELVGPHQILRPLADLPLDRRQQLRGHGGIQDVLQHVRQLLVLVQVVPGHVVHQMAHQGLGDGGVDGVHAHVVPVVGAPAQGQLAEIPGADDQSAVLVGHVHEHLGPLPGLGVLKGHVLVLHAVADIPEVAANRVPDGDGVEGGPHALRQKHGVVPGPVRGAEAGHGHGDDVAGRPVEHPHGQGGNQQGQGAVQAAGEAHHRCFRARVLQPLFQA